MDIQYAFDWDNDHMFSFYFGGKLFDKKNEYSATPLGDLDTFGMSTSSKLAANTQIRDVGLQAGSTFLYVFDYGNELVHEIIVDRIRDKNDEDKELPTVVSEIGIPPPQYGEIE